MDSVQISPHLERVLLQILQVLLVNVRLNLVHRLHRLPLYVRIFPLYLNVRNLYYLLVRVHQVNYQLVHTTKFRYLDSVVQLSRLVRIYDELLDRFALHQRKVNILIVYVEPHLSREFCLPSCNYPYRPYLHLRSEGHNEQ